MFKNLLDSVNDHATSSTTKFVITSPGNQDALIEHSTSAREVFSGKCKRMPPLIGPNLSVGKAIHSDCRLFEMLRSRIVTLNGF